MQHGNFLNKPIKSLTLAVMSAFVLLPIYQAQADNEISNWRDDPLQLNVKFEHRHSAYNNFASGFNSQDSDTGSQELSWQADFDVLALTPQNRKYSLDNKLLRQYDATFFYPFQTGKFNFDLGVNIKFIKGVSQTTNEFGTVSSQSYNATLPMMYATALYELPWSGLSAGIEGKHMVIDNSTAFDYKAVLTYQSRNGFGLHGGWQYQQLHLNAFQNITTSSESAGPFVDFYFNF